MDTTGDVFGLLKMLCSLQEERAYTYKLLEEGHKIYLATAPNYDFTTFRQLVHEVTQEFKRISSTILEIQRKLRDCCDSPTLAEHIARLQEFEEQKLLFTTQLQLAKQTAVDRPDAMPHSSIISIKKGLNAITENINDCLEEIKFAMNDL